ncbi:MAG: response regulator [Candidatus Cloacimonadaceae bacterium]
MPEPKTKILVVDDSISMVDGLVKILQVSGYDADPAYNGQDALRKLGVKEFDLILCDIEMPGLTGLDLLKHVRQDYDEIPFVLMTGFLEQEYFIRAIQLGASDFIRKPIDTEHLLYTIQLQINKKTEDSDVQKAITKFDKADVNFVINPAMFDEVDFTKAFTIFFRNNLNLHSSLINELLLCIEEIIYNALIHGTLKLNLKERTLNHSQYKEVVKQKLQNPEIAQKRIHISLSVDLQAKILSFTVEDEGDGFDFDFWLKKINTSQTIQLDEYGRGISIIYHLTDKLTFDKGGRRISIEKKFEHAAPLLKASN